MFVFKIDKVPFTGLHCTPESYPAFLLELQHKEKFEGKKQKIFTQTQEKATSL